MLEEASAPTKPDPPAPAADPEEADTTLTTPISRRPPAANFDESESESEDEEEDPEVARLRQIERSRVLEAAGVITHSSGKKRRQAPAPPPSSKSTAPSTDDFVDAPETLATTPDEEVGEDPTDDAYARYLRL